mgnify:CR=1 FL=1
MGKETEYKLAVGDLQLLDCILCSRMVMEKLCAPYAYIRMRTTYYDTEDGFLAQRRWMLRLRTEDGRSVVTMKTPGEGHTRGEWEVESAYLDEALPKLAALGAGRACAHLRGKLHPHHGGAAAVGEHQLHDLRRRRRSDRRGQDGAAVRAGAGIKAGKRGSAFRVRAGAYGHLSSVRAAAQQTAARTGACRINRPCTHAAEK